MEPTLSTPKRKSHWLLPLGIVVLVVALLWWFAYYGQWKGWFTLLDVKLGCLMGDAFECANFQDFIGPSAVPVYSPFIWYAGILFVLVGLYLTRRNKA